MPFNKFSCHSCKAIFSLLLLGTTAVGVRADVSWEHKATVRISKFKKPLVQMKMFTNWTSQRSRVLLKYDFSGMSQVGASPTDVFAGVAPDSKLASSPVGGIGIIQRLDDDRLIGYATQAKGYIDEKITPLAQRLRFDPWKKLAPELSKEAPPELTMEQRKRLGAEVRAVMKPFTRQVMRFYFRQLPTKRTFEGIEAQGYRFTYMINAGGISPMSQQWMRVNMELWMAPDLPGDDEIRDYNKAARDESRRALWRSTSMWVNEALPVVWQTMPEELHQFVQTLVPPLDSPRGGFGGTPVRIYYSVAFPPMQRASVGDVREEIALVRRDTSPLAASVFEAPTGYKHYPLDKYLKQYEEIMKGNLPGMSTFNDTMGFSWQAWKQYARVARTQVPLAFYE